MRTLIFLAVVAVGCDSNVMVVTVEKRPAVVDARSLHVTVSNAGELSEHDFDLADKTFPATFGIRLGDRSGELDVAIDALDETGALRGRGQVVAPLEGDARVMLDPMDFVVNTITEGDQALGGFDAHGGQLAATSDGTWTVAFTAPSDVLARRFDVRGQPLDSAAAGDNQQFKVSVFETALATTPAVASSPSGISAIVAWDDDRVPPSSQNSIQCRPILANGALGDSQVQIATDEAPFGVTAAVLSNGNFVLSWAGRLTTQMIRRAMVNRDCTVLRPGDEVSFPGPAGVDPIRSHVAANSSAILHSWVLGNAIRVRASDVVGTPETQDKELFSPPAGSGLVVEHARIAPLPAGFAIAIRQVNSDMSMPGRIDLVRTDSGGNRVGDPLRVTDQSGSSFFSNESFGIASTPAGDILIVWASCDGDGDGDSSGGGSRCGVFGQFVGSDGVLKGARISLATTTAGDQRGPSAVALPDGAFATVWTDDSRAIPDVTGTAIRARIVYMP